jgi:hypothetical protein
MCVPPRAPDVDDVADQDEKAHNVCGNGLSDGVVVRGEYIHVRSGSNGIERQPNSVGNEQHNSEGYVRPTPPDVGDLPAKVKISPTVGMVVASKIEKKIWSCVVGYVAT